MAARGFVFHREVIRRNEFYKDHFKLVLLLRKKSHNHSDFWRLNKTVTKFYSIKGIRNLKLTDLKRTLKRQLLSAWGLHRLDDFPEPFEFGDSKASEASKRYKVISVHKKAKPGEKVFNSILKQIKEEFETGARIFICIRQGCTKEDLDSIRWDKDIHQAYGKNPSKKSDPERDIQIWDKFKENQRNKKVTQDKLCSLLKSEFAAETKHCTEKSILLAYYRTNKAINSCIRNS